MLGNNNDEGGAGGNDAAAVAAAKATADAAAAAAAAGAGDGKGGGDGEETVTIKKSDLKKIEEDRDNYKKMGLQKKADERDLHAGAGGGGGGGAGVMSVIDEKKIGETATAATNKAMRDASERTAKRTFLRAHPEYVDDAQWTSMISNLTFRGNEVTVEEVSDRMEAAVLEHKRSTGKLDEYLKSEHGRGIREGRIQGELGSGHGTGGAGDRNDGKGAGQLSPKGEEMARAMHTDPEKVRKVDTSKDNVIDLSKV